MSSAGTGNWFPRPVIFNNPCTHNELETNLHRAILMNLQLNQQRTFHILANGSDEGWMPNPEIIICPKCGQNDWKIFDTELETKDKFVFSMGAFLCKNKTCNFLFPERAKIPNDL